MLNSPFWHSGCVFSLLSFHAQIANQGPIALIFFMILSISYIPCPGYMQKLFTGLLAHGWCAPLHVMVVFDTVMLLVMEAWMIKRSNITLWMMQAVL